MKDHIWVPAIAEITNYYVTIINVFSPFNVNKISLVRF